MKAICNAHDGEVKVVSQEGVGSNFTVELPLCELGKVKKADSAVIPKDAAPKTWTVMSEKSIRT